VGVWQLSEIRATTISDAAGTGPATLTGQYAAKAWVNFNGSGTVAIRESGNVSSITDNGTGDYTVNFGSAFADANYCVASILGYTGANSGSDVLIHLNNATAPTSSLVRLANSYIYGTSKGLYDTAYVNCLITR
jgi:hypothetical protein